MFLLFFLSCCGYLRRKTILKQVDFLHFFLFFFSLFGDSIDEIKCYRQCSSRNDWQRVECVATDNYQAECYENVSNIQMENVKDLLEILWHSDLKKKKQVKETKFS